ncbi:MAG: single-stranded-DNA-specific exonuclease RecJ [Chitinispirillaceae bacterium]
MTFDAARERISLREIDTQIADHLAKELNVPQAVATILTGRKLTSFDECKRFFRPQLSHLHDPFLFRDMEKAVRRTKQAIDSKEKIVIYGDYDVDGVTSTALLVRVLRRLGAECDYYLPNRLTEGYGMSEAGIRQIAQGGATLVITVDCGITAVAEAKLAGELGIDLIITDHHEPKETLPDALAVIDHKVPDCSYPDSCLAGVGVALKFCQALGMVASRSEELWLDLVELAALGTAADIVPLTGENRVIAFYGFDNLQKTEVVGLRALLQEQGLTGKKISTGEAVFQIAPSINAVGRLGDPRRGVELLLTDDSGLATVYAKELREANHERRALDSTVAEEARRWVECNCHPDNDFGLVLGNADWHVGVIGIVASKLVERFHRPSILLSIGKDGIAKGSGRSIPGLHLLETLDECGSLLKSFGGHAAAAGLSIHRDKIDTFREKFNEVVRSKLGKDDLTPRVTADVEVSIAALTPKLLRIIKQMAPFGPGNMRPVLLCRDLQHRYSPRVVGQKHLKLCLTSRGVVMDAIGFNFGERIHEVKDSTSMKVAFALEENEWNGKKRLQMNIKGITI